MGHWLKDLRAQKYAHEEKMREEKEEIVEDRQQGKTDRQNDRSQALEVAYQNGIDPKADMANAIGKTVSNLGSDVAGVFGGKGTGQSGYSKQPAPAPATKGCLGISIIIIALGGFGTVEFISFTVKHLLTWI